MQPGDAIRNLTVLPLQWVLMMFSLLLVACGGTALDALSPRRHRCLLRFRACCLGYGLDTEGG